VEWQTQKEGDDKAMSERSFEEDLRRAMLLAREFRLHAVAQNLDPKAVRVAIIFLNLIDDHFAAKKLDAKTILELEEMAQKLSAEVIKSRGTIP
jgi:hypothetical protein